MTARLNIHADVLYYDVFGDADILLSNHHHHSAFFFLKKISIVAAAFILLYFLCHDTPLTVATQRRPILLLLLLLFCWLVNKTRPHDEMSVQKKLMKLSDGSTHSVQTQQQQHQLIYFLLPSCLTCFCSFFFYILMRDREEKVWRNVLCWFESSIESTRNTQKSGKKIKQNTHTPFSFFFF